MPPTRHCVLRAGNLVSCRPAAQQQADGWYGDDICGYGSDGDPLSFQDVEGMVASHTYRTDVVTDEQCLAWQQRFNSTTPAFATLEQLSSAVTMQYMDAQGQ